MKSEVYAANRKEWRSWLTRNHAKAEEVWLIYYKKHTRKPTISYLDSVEEALCFGWIDGLKKSIDSEKYAYRFTPRKAKSKWSPLNTILANKMIDAGNMTETGLAAFKRKLSYDEEMLNARTSTEIPLPPEIKNSLKKNRRAWKNFNNLAPSYRKQYVGWLRSAKRQETMERRLKEAIKLLANNEKLGMR